MSELGQQDTQDGFHEIQLSGKQLVFLFMATTIVAVVIFLCGVQVGRNVKTDRAGDAAETVATAAPAASASTAPQATASPRARSSRRLFLSRRTSFDSRLDARTADSGCDWHTPTEEEVRDCRAQRLQAHRAVP